MRVISYFTKIFNKVINPWEKIFRDNKGDDNNMREDRESSDNGDEWYNKLKFPKEFKSFNITHIVIGLLFLWLCSGFYAVNTDEQGVVIRLGKYNRTSNSGLNYHIPYPIEQVEKVSVTRINKELVGVDSSDDDVIENDDSVNKGSKESQMLTHDENIIDMRVFVQWRVINPSEYLFNIKHEGGVSIVKLTAESVIREQIGVVKLHDALSEKRSLIEHEIADKLQVALDYYKSGIKIENVGILYAYVVDEVRDSYREVQAAKANRESKINEAQEYRNKVIPEARGTAHAIVAEAEAYANSIILRAKGEADKFSNMLAEYKKYGDIVKQKIYFDTMKEVVGGSNKVIMDDKITTMPLININDLFKKEKTSKSDT